MDSAWIIQIILIPILTVFLNSIVITLRERTKRNLEKDKQLFEAFIKEFPEGSDLIYMLKEDSFRHPIPSARTKEIEAMYRLLSLTSHTYMNRKIEKAKNRLQQSIESFHDFSTANLFPSERDPEEYVANYYYQYIGMGWSEEGEKNFFEVVKKFDSLTTDIYIRYSEFIKTARKYT